MKSSIPNYGIKPPNQNRHSDGTKQIQIIFLMTVLIALCLLNIVSFDNNDGISSYQYQNEDSNFLINELQIDDDRVLNEQVYDDLNDSTEDDNNSRSQTISNLLKDILSAKQSAFDTLAKTFYKKAISLESIQDNEASRKRLIVKEWSNQVPTWGGLFNKDRELLGDLYYNASSIFEYGLGESTYIAAHTRVPRYAGVDSDVQWVSSARDKVVDKYNASNFRFYFADIGPTLQWGKPADQNLAKIAYNYQIAPLVSELQPFEVYMIDGRYRVSCACVAFLHALKYANGGADYVRKNVKVAIHDATARENSFGRYGQLKRIAEVVGKAQELWVYRLKEDVSEEDIYELWKTNTKIQFRRHRRLHEAEGVSELNFDSVQHEAYRKAIEIPDDVPKNDEDEVSNDFIRSKVVTTAENRNTYISGTKVTDKMINLYRNSSSVFEFGVGKAADIALYTDIERFTGSDSIASSIATARNITVESNLNHFRYFFSDVGETNIDGTAADEENEKIWYNYGLAPLVVENEAFDLYVIDGRRYGLFSACISFLHAIKHKADMSKVSVLVYEGGDFDFVMKSFSTNIGAPNKEKGDSNMYRLLPGKGEGDIITVLLESL